VTGRLARALALGAAGAAVAGGSLLAYAHLVEPRRLTVERWTVRVPGLPPAWEGLRIVHLTDFQVGMWGEARSLPARAVRRALALTPDLVFLTGDFTDAGRWSSRLEIFRPLAERARCYAVLGNHDHLKSAADTEAIAAGLRAQGITVLMNEHAELSRDGETWQIVGIDDLATEHADLLAAITGIPRDRKLLALLTHVPEGADYAPEGWFPLIVAGHTHGAQIRLSLLRRLSWLRLAVGASQTKYPRGWFEVRGGLLYVNRGLGLSNLPLRFGAPPEVALFVLSGGAQLPGGVHWQRREPE
jgi:predicted MPP superfamily phosphohydrolase